MTFSKVTVRTGEQLRQWNVDQWTSFLFLAVLSAEPETWEDWDAALRRYLPEHQLLSQGSATNDISGAISDSPWCLIDVIGKTVILGGGFEPLENGRYRREEDDEDDATEVLAVSSPESSKSQKPDSPVAWMEIPECWWVTEAIDGWEQILSHRAAVSAQTPRIESRVVLYGAPLYRFLAERVMLAEGVASWNSEEEYRATKAVHADWLMTPRDDLLGKIPRDFLHETREAIQLDLEHRSYQWSLQGFPPEGLPETSAAYRYAGWGTAEVVLYFEMIRAIMEEAWNLRRWATEKRRPSPESCTSVEKSPQNTEELAQALATFAQHWLRKPSDEDFSELSPLEMIESERRRMPITGDTPFDQRDLPSEWDLRGRFGPSFLWFDGHHLELEDEFAFSLIACRDEWEDIQGSYTMTRRDVGEEDVA